MTAVPAVGGVVLGSATMPKKFRNQGCRMLIVWRKDKTPETKKVSWTAAGNQIVKTKLRSGSPHIIAVIMAGVKVDTPVSPPIYKNCQRSTEGER